MIDFGLALAERLELAVLVARGRHDRVEQPVDAQAARGDGSRDTVDEERHIAIDGDQTHPPAASFATG